MGIPYQVQLRLSRPSQCFLMPSTSNQRGSSLCSQNVDFGQKKVFIWSASPNVPVAPGQQIAVQGISFNRSQISKNRNQEFRKSLRRLAICAFSSRNIIVNSISLNISGLQSRGISENIAITLSAHSRRICPRPWHQLMFNRFENGSTEFTNGWMLTGQAKMQRMHSFR